MQKGSFIKRLEPFPVYKQETDHTCGPASLRMLLEYLGDVQPEARLAASCMTLPTGALHLPVLWGMNRYLKKLNMRAVMSGDDPLVYEKIKASLDDNLPVLMIFSVIDVFHPPNKVMHYGVITGIDETADLIYIANPFGHIEEMPIDEWRARFSHSPEHASPLTRALMMFRLLKPNTCYLVERKPDGRRRP